MGFLGRECHPPQPTRGSGERRELPQRGPGEPRPPTHSRHISAPQKPSSRRLLKFWGPEICLVETKIYNFAKKSDRPDRFRRPCIATVDCLSVCLSVCPYVCDVVVLWSYMLTYCYWTVITGIISLVSPLLGRSPKLQPSLMGNISKLYWQNTSQFSYLLALVCYDTRRQNFKHI